LSTNSKNDDGDDDDENDNVDGEEKEEEVLRRFCAHSHTAKKNNKRRCAIPNVFLVLAVKAN